MGRRPQQLPGDLSGAGFTMADARDLGVRGRLRTGFEIPSHGLRFRPGEQGPSDVGELARLVRSVVPEDAVISHLTAARLLGLPTPRPWGRDEPVHVSRDSGRPWLERRGVLSHNGLETRAVTQVHGLPVVAALHTWSDLAGSWTRPQLVAAGDALLRDHDVTPAQVLRHLETLSGRRGIRTLREVAPFLDPGSASPKESEARLLFRDHGLPTPELNVRVCDDWGVLIGVADFLWREPKVVAEYDGDQHRTDRSAWQYERDRRARFEAAGWTYVELTNIHLVRAAYTRRLIARLGDLLL